MNEENNKELKERYDAVEEKLKRAKYIELKLEEQQMVCLSISLWFLFLENISVQLRLSATLK